MGIFNLILNSPKSDENQPLMKINKRSTIFSVPNFIGLFGNIR